MSDVAQDRKERKPIRRQRSIYQVHYSLQRRSEEMARPLAPPDPQAPQAPERYGSQVAGHRGCQDTKYLGLLQYNGKVLKPILKECQEREVEFYTRLASSTHPALVELRALTPRYHGRRKFTYNGHELDYIILEDLTHRMLEPCIMDVKIGRRTWDPLASPEKIEREKSKYRLCKEQFAFCIPGYQVYRLRGGLARYGKECGKKLHGNMVVAAIRNFLNGGSGGGVCRALLLQLAGGLWALQRWAARRAPLRLYAASLLLVYDAARLRRCCQPDPHTNPHTSCRPPAAPIARRRSIHSLHPTPGGPREPPPGPAPRAPPAAGAESPWAAALAAAGRWHSWAHDYEDEVCRMKLQYRAALQQLAGDCPRPSPWGAVRLIDFAHAFFNDDGTRLRTLQRLHANAVTEPLKCEESVDENFKEGIDNFVAIFESLLQETDDQVF